MGANLPTPYSEWAITNQDHGHRQTVGEIKKSSGIRRKDGKLLFASYEGRLAVHGLNSIEESTQVGDACTAVREGFQEIKTNMLEEFLEADLRHCTLFFTERPYIQSGSRERCELASELCL